MAGATGGGAGGPAAPELFSIAESPLSSLDGPLPAGDTPSAALRGLDIDIVIVLDVTRSMDWCLAPAKELALGVLNTAGRLRAARSVRCGVVAYRDLKSRADKPDSHTQILELTDNVDEVASFINGLRAYGGDDAAEDVAGAFEEAIVSDWRVPVPVDKVTARQSSKMASRVASRRSVAGGGGQAPAVRSDTNCRMIIHLWDAPPHGSAYHDLPAGDSYDRFASEGPEWDRDNRLFLSGAGEMAQFGIGYVGLRATPEGQSTAPTDKAWQAFRGAYMAASPRIDPLDYPLNASTKPSEIVRVLARATEASIAAFSKSIGGRMARAR